MPRDSLSTRSDRELSTWNTPGVGLHEDLCPDERGRGSVRALATALAADRGAAAQAEVIR